MLPYHLTLEEHTAWRVDSARFADSLRQSWAHISIVLMPTAFDVLGWEIIWEQPIPPLNLKPFVSGYLARDLQNISITGSFEECVDFALWYRNFVPYEHRLFFQDEPLTNQIELSTKTTKGQIMKSFIPTLHSMHWEILYILERANGKTKLSSMIDTLRVPFADIPYATFLKQAYKAVDTLWEQDIISSPGSRWGFQTPKETEGITSIPAFQGGDISLTHKGWRALKAKQW